MITTKDIETMGFGLKKGKKYSIFSRSKRKKGEAIISEGIYIGESGVCNDYLIFKFPKTNVIECFLKIDIVTGEYIIKELKKHEGVIVRNG